MATMGQGWNNMKKDGKVVEGFDKVRVGIALWNCPIQQFYYIQHYAPIRDECNLENWSVQLGCALQMGKSIESL